MKRYFLHLNNRDGLVLDEEGSFQKDLDAARGHAVLAAREMIAADVQLGVVDLDQSIIIHDESGAVLGEVAFATVLRFVGAGKAGPHGSPNPPDQVALPSFDPAAFSPLEGD